MLQHKVVDKKQLVAACQAGNSEAQGQLYTTYRRKMMKVIRQYVADYDMALDVLCIWGEKGISSTSTSPSTRRSL